MNAELGINTHEIEYKYSELSKLAKSEIKAGFGDRFDKGPRYLEAFTDGTNAWTVKTLAAFTELVEAQHRVQFPEAYCIDEQPN